MNTQVLSKEQTIVKYSQEKIFINCKPLSEIKEIYGKTEKRGKHTKGAKSYFVDPHMTISFQVDLDRLNIDINKSFVNIYFYKNRITIKRYKRLSPSKKEKIHPDITISWEQMNITEADFCIDFKERDLIYFAGKKLKFSDFFSKSQDEFKNVFHQNPKK